VSPSSRQQLERGDAAIVGIRALGAATAARGGGLVAASESDSGIAESDGYPKELSRARMARGWRPGTRASRLAPPAATSSGRSRSCSKERRV